MKLDNMVHKKIEELSQEGNILMENNKFDEAIEKFNAAIALVPSPKSEWEASTWLYTAIGDAFFLKKDYKNAKDSFYNALNCPKGLSNPFILLRIGQSLFECKELDKAKEFLLKAYMLEGTGVFNDEDEKYIELIKEII